MDVGAALSEIASLPAQNRNPKYKELTIQLVASESIAGLKVSRDAISLLRQALAYVREGEDCNRETLNLFTSSIANLIHASSQTLLDHLLSQENALFSRGALAFLATEITKLSSEGFREVRE